MYGILWEGTKSFLLRTLTEAFDIVMHVLLFNDYKNKWIAPVDLHAISWSNADWEWPQMAANYFFSSECYFIIFFIQSIKINLI